MILILTAGPRAEEDSSHLDWHSTRDGGLACPCKRLAHVSGFDDRETTDVLLGFRVGAIGNHHVAVRLPTQRLGHGWRLQTPSETPEAGTAAPEFDMRSKKSSSEHRVEFGVDGRRLGFLSSAAPATATGGKDGLQFLLLLRIKHE
jgi:hypothetical protein